MAATVRQQRLNRKMDPYLELEFYLARAQKDIGDAFDRLELSADNGCPKEPAGQCKKPASNGRSRPQLKRPAGPPTPPARSDSFKYDRMSDCRSSSVPPRGSLVVSDVDSLSTFVDALLKEVATMTSSEHDEGDKEDFAVTPTQETKTVSCNGKPASSVPSKRNCDLEEFLRQVETSISSRSPLPDLVDIVDELCDATTQTSPPVSDHGWNSDVTSEEEEADTYSSLDSETTSTSCGGKLARRNRLSKLAPLNVAIKCDDDQRPSLQQQLLLLGPSSAPAGSEWLSAAPPLAPSHWVSLWLDVNKSSSAPMLDSRGHQVITIDSSSSYVTSTRDSQSATCSHSPSMPSKNRSQSAKQLTELEAVEACKWLRAAGFPQYAQMFEDMQFPIDVSSVQKDHYFLDQDSMQSLFRRLNALNRCARMRLDNVPRKNSVRADDSDEENQCALSENWKFQRQSRRWSRIPGNFDAALLAAQKAREDLESSTSAVITTEAERSDISSSILPGLRDEDDVRRHLALATAIATAPELAECSAVAGPAAGLRRTGSDRFKDGAKALLRKVESLKTRRSRRKNREAVVISGPQLLDVPVSPPDTPSAQQTTVIMGGGGSSSTPPSSNSPSDASQQSTPQSVHTTDAQASVQCFFGGSTRRRGGDKDSYALSDSECSPTLWRSRPSSPTKVTRCYIQQYLTPEDSPRLFPDGASSTLFPYNQKRRGAANQDDDDDDDDDDDLEDLDDDGGINYRTGSFHLGRNDSAAYRGRFVKGAGGASVDKSRGRGGSLLKSDVEAGSADDRHSLYDNVPVVIFNKGYTDEHGEPLHEKDIFKNITNLNLAFGAARATSFEQKSAGFEESVSTTTTASSSNEDQGDSASLTSSTVQLPSGATTTSAERRDSGVGLSISRSNSRESAVQQQQQTQAQPRWQMSSQCHRPSIPCRSLPLNGLSTGQMIVLRKLALLKLTSCMERYCPSNRTGWNCPLIIERAMPKFIKRMKMPDYKDKAVFGVPLTVILQRTGQPIPLSIQAAIRHLRKNAMDSVGLFRKSGVRSRIQKLKNLSEASGCGGGGNTTDSTPTSDLTRMTSMYEEQQPYDVADMVKQYFRELPEALLTNKMSSTFISIYQYVGEDVRLEALQASLILMPDENREVLQALLSFLSDVSSRAQENQMTASNLAVCFAPSLFHMNSPRRSSHSSSPRRRKTVGAPDQRELNETRAAHECLTHMIRDFHRIFSIPEDILVQCRCPELDLGEAPTMDDLFQQQRTMADVVVVVPSAYRCNWHAMVEAGIQWIFKESREKFKGGWTSTTDASAAADVTEVSFKKLGDGNPLRIWKVTVEVEAPPVELLNRVLRERHLWDADLLKWRVIDRLDKQTEIFQYVTNSMMPLPPRDFCVLRSWRTDFPKGTCVLVEMSVEHPDARPLVNGVRANVLSSTYLIEPCGSGKSRVTHVSRVDIRGRSPDWYNKVYGSLCSLFISQLRDSLQHIAEGPESKV